MSLTVERTVLQKRYKILKVLGSGGICTVYLAQDLLLPKVWAIKEFSNQNLASEEKIKIESQFNKEAEILSSLNHPGLPEIADFFSENENKYIVMEFFEGETLEDIIKKENRPLEEEKVRLWALQICEILDYLHSHKPCIIHRDIKPQNLIVTKENEIKFIDFGIARIFNPVKKQDTIFMGTPGFASPEQFGQGQTDPRSDIFSLGATLHYLLSNHDPGNNPFMFAPLSIYKPDISKDMEEVIIKSLEIEPSHRFSSVKEIIKVLSNQVRVSDLPSIPWPLLEPSEILLNNVPYKNIETSFKIKNAGDGVLGGQIKSHSPWIKILNEEFAGNDEEINIMIDKKHLAREKKHTGNIEIITSMMKKIIPVEVTFLPDFFKRLSQGKVCAILWLIPAILYVYLLPYCKEPPVFITDSYMYFSYSALSTVILISLLTGLNSKTLFLIGGSIITVLPVLLLHNHPDFISSILLFISWSNPSVFILSAFLSIITLNTYFLFTIYDKLSPVQKKTVHIPLMIALLLPPIFWVLNKQSIYNKQSVYKTKESSSETSTYWGIDSKKLDRIKNEVSPESLIFIESIKDKRFKDKNDFMQLLFSQIKNKTIPYSDEYKLESVISPHYSTDSTTPVYSTERPVYWYIDRKKLETIRSHGVFRVTEETVDKIKDKIDTDKYALQFPNKYSYFTKEELRQTLISSGFKNTESDLILSYAEEIHLNPESLKFIESIKNQKFNEDYEFAEFIASNPGGIISSKDETIIINLLISPSYSSEGSPEYWHKMNALSMFLLTAFILFIYYLCNSISTICQKLYIRNYM